MGNGYVIFFGVKYKPGFYNLGLVIVLMFSTLSCQQNHQEQKVSKLEGGKLGPQQLQGLYDELLVLESEIQTFPQDVQLRKGLLQKAKTKSPTLLVAAGYGVPPTGDLSETIKRHSAEQAAFVDACRWLGYMKLWEQDISQPDFGNVQTHVQNVQKIYVNFSSTNQAQVLVEMPVK